MRFAWECRLLALGVMVPGAVVAQNADGGRQPAVRARPADTVQVRIEDGQTASSPPRWRLDTFVSDPPNTRSIAPVAWWNQSSDATVGVRLRGNDEGRYNRWEVWVHRGVNGPYPVTLGDAVDIALQVDNPRGLAFGGWEPGVRGWVQEGTVGAAVWVHREAGDRRATRYRARWVATKETGFLDARLWENAGTIELERRERWRLGTRTRWTISYSGIGGWAYRRATRGAYAGEAFGRIEGAVAVRRELGPLVFGARVYAGGYLGGEVPVRQRGIMVHGADPYETLTNPLLRSEGAPLAGSDVPYHAPGGANLRGYRPGLGGRWAVSANLEVEGRLIRRHRGVLRSLGVTGFWDSGTVDTLAVPSFSSDPFQTLSDAGVGIRAALHVGDIDFPVRIEFPLFVSAPLSAHDRRQGTQQVEFRWLVSLQPTF